jgi:hypothetical protein
MKSSLFIFIFATALGVGSVGSTLISSHLYLLRISLQEQERISLEEKLQPAVAWLLSGKHINTVYEDTSVTLVDHSAKINLYYDNELILRLPSVRSKMSNIDGLMATRSQRWAIDTSSFIEEEHRDFFSIYTHAHPLTSDKDRFKQLYRLSTGRDFFSIRLEELINKGELISPQAFLQSIQYNTAILPFIHPAGRFNVHTMDLRVLEDLLALPVFNVQQVSQKVQRIRAQRSMPQAMTVLQLQAIFADEEDLNPLLFAYLGVQSHFYEIIIEGERESMHALIICLPLEYVESPESLIAWRRYLPNA